MGTQQGQQLHVRYRKAHPPGEICGMSAQHTQHQGKQVARNVTASLGIGRAEPYKHDDVGFLVDLAGGAAVAAGLGLVSSLGAYEAWRRSPAAATLDRLRS